MAKTPTVNELKSQGYNVRVYHRRYAENINSKRPFAIMNSNELRKLVKYPDYDGYNRARFHPFGGETWVHITTPEGLEVTGYAECSLKDHFCKKIGRDIAIGRALHNIETRKRLNI